MHSFLHREIEDVIQDLAFAGEVPVNGAVADSGMSRDIGDGGVVIPLLGEHRERR